jgi:hypothetical protein
MFSFPLYHKKWLYVQNYVELEEIGEILMLGGLVWTTKEREKARKARRGGLGMGEWVIRSAVSEASNSPI